jgi:hypothetical protein
MPEGLGWQTRGHLRQANWPCAPHMGLCRSGPALLASPPQGQQLLARVEKKHAKGKALSLLAHTRGRAVYCMRQRQAAFARRICLQTSGSRAGEPSASLDSSGRRLQRARSLSNVTASVNATVGRGPVSLRPGDCWATRSGAGLRGVCAPPVAGAAPPPRLARTGEAPTLRQAYGIGRYEGTPSLLGRRADPPRGAAIVTHVMMAPHYVCGAATLVVPVHSNHARTRDRLPSSPVVARRQKTHKAALRGGVSLDKKRPHKG